MYITPMGEKGSIYLHIPFCASKCLYCDFASFGGLESAIDEYAGAALKEIKEAPRFKAETFFIGGGTPSYFPVHLIEKIVSSVIEKFSVKPDDEVTIEVNPNSVDREAMEKYLEMGINRISIGIQSFDARMLRVLGRRHSPREAVEAVEDAKRAGFRNISADLMYGLPGQNREMLSADLKAALELDIPHLSVYQLTLEKRTPLSAMVKKGAVTMPDDDFIFEMTGDVENALENAGYVRYEISNYAKPGNECRHNVNYWMGGEYLGIGSGAHSFFDGRRFANIERPSRYISEIFKNGKASFEIKTDNTSAVTDYMLMRMRLINNEMAFDELSNRLNVDFVGKYGDTIKKLEKSLYIKTSEGRSFKLTKKGVLFLNDVLLEFVKV